jgi:hypothetical protein
MPHMAQHRTYRSNESQVKLHEGKDGRSRAAAACPALLRIEKQGPQL